MHTHSDAYGSSGRYAALLSEKSCERPIYDEILCETDGCVIVPTLGSIVPNWLLVIPRRPVLNFVRWQAETDVSPSAVIERVLTGIGADPARAIWFEHGPAVAGSTIGCGTDHAHLHLLVAPAFTFQEFRDAAESLANLIWRSEQLNFVYESLGPHASYLVAGSHDKSVFATDVETIGSQFFRRVVAKLAGRPTEWNYRSHPFLENIEATVSRLAIS